MPVNVKSIEKKHFCKITNENVLLALNYIDDKIKTKPKVYSCNLFVTNECTGNFTELTHCPYYEKLQTELNFE